MSNQSSRHPLLQLSYFIFLLKEYKDFQKLLEILKLGYLIHQITKNQYLMLVQLFHSKEDVIIVIFTL